MAPLVNIRQLRHNRGWTLAVAADLFGITESALSLIERGLRVPTVTVAHSIASAYDLTPSDIWPVDPVDTTPTEAAA